MVRLFDLSAEFFRNYFGCGKRSLQAYELTIEKVGWYWHDSRRMVVCCDSPQNFRKALDPTYKANREEKEPAAIDALVSVEERARAWGCPVACSLGFEADDIIATLAAQAYPEEVEIIGEDKDLYSLIGEGVTLASRRGPVGVAECIEKFGVPPEQMTEFLAMCSDSADNVKGCQNCGPDRSAKLLDHYGSISAIQSAARAGIIEIKGIGPKTIAALCDWDATRALELVRLRTDVPLQLDELLPPVGEDAA